MASLFWNSRRRPLDGRPVSEIRAGIRSELQQLGFVDIRVGDLEVAGSRGEAVVSVGHFPIAPGEVWEITMCAGPDGATAQRTRDDVVEAIRSLTFFD